MREEPVPLPHQRQAAGGHLQPQPAQPCHIRHHCVSAAAGSERELCITCSTDPKSKSMLVQLRLEKCPEGGQREHCRLLANQSAAWAVLLVLAMWSDGLFLTCCQKATQGG
jgi:hypothetical protein